jgi:ABC-type antimicrobial peptide transport system permease subunit
MLHHHLLLAYRNILKNRISSLVNIGGLALGISIAILIGLWIWDELSYNKYHQHYDNIAQVWVGRSENGKLNSANALPYPLKGAIATQYGQHFQKVLRASWVDDFILSQGDQKIKSKGEFIEHGVIEMLSLKMLQGNSSSLKDLHSIILAASTAKALFGDRDPMGETMKIDNHMDAVVSGIYEDIPDNNRFGEVKFFSNFELFASSNEWVQGVKNDWNDYSFNLYVQIRPEAEMEKVDALLANFYRKNGANLLPEQAAKSKPSLKLVPMKTWRLYGEMVNGKPSAGRIIYVYLFAYIGLFVLLLACINFVNLSTARSEKRAKGVGILKAIGVSRMKLVFQFLSESFLIVALAFGVSFVFLALLLPSFNHLVDKKLHLPFEQALFWAMLLGFWAITGLLAGLYPAFYLSAFQPVKVLKGTIRKGRFAALPRQVLVSVQFTVSVLLMIGTVVVYQQIQHARNRPIGYDPQKLITVSMNDPGYFKKFEAIRAQLKATRVVKEVACSSSPMTGIWDNTDGWSWKGKDPATSSVFAFNYVSNGFGKTAGFEFTKGRDFSNHTVIDSNSVIINEAAVKFMQLENPIGEQLRHERDGLSLNIIGVVKDQISESPYDPVRPMVYWLSENYISHLHIKIKPEAGAGDALKKIEKALKKVAPTMLFDYRFIDSEYGAKFSQEQRIGELAGFCGLMAILISCLGLFGLASFVAEQRTKEIGIRKVLGANLTQLWALMSRDFLLPVLIACFLAIPIANHYLQNWLESYTYRVELSWVVFAIVGLGALAITLLTVSYQAIRTALLNPSKTLKSE